MFEIVENQQFSRASIKVVGVGGGGGNAVEHMLASDIEGVEFVCANTDAQALERSSAPVHMRLGANLTKGLGAGADPEVGRAAAVEDRERIGELLEGTDMVFITAGMGGGTGTGASPVIAELAREMGVLTVAVVTRPFAFEMKRRTAVAAAGIEELSQHVDSLLVVPNERLISVLGGGVSLKAAFAAANDVLREAVQGIAELIVRPGLMNVDFADVRTVMSEKGRALMGSGRASGEGRGIEAAKKAITCPLLEAVDLRGARGILVNITTSSDLDMDEYTAVGEVVQEFAAEDANVITGTVIDEGAGDELRVVVVATGLGAAEHAQPEPRPEPQPEPALRAASGACAAVPGGGGADVLPFASQDAEPGEEDGRRAADAGFEPGAAPGFEDRDYFDIPAYIRRRAQGSVGA